MKGLIYSAISASLLFAALPSSSNYQLHNYNYGSGGTSNSTSANYGLNATTGQPSNVQSGSTNFLSRPGNNNTQQAYVPAAPTFTNTANYYNKLRFIVNPSSNPTDTVFSIAISTDNFATTNYIQSDNTIGAVRGLEDYQTYAAWGGASGQFVVGLAHSTTYQIKANAMQGRFTETEYGPSASAATVAPSITFDIDVASTNTDTNPPFTASFGDLLPATVTTAANRIWIDIDTNGEAGAKVYINSANAGLFSSSKSFTLASATADLAVAATGYGAQGASVAQGSGGPLSITSPYNVAAQNVGILGTALREIFSSSTPITAGRGSLYLIAKASATTPASGDYQDTITVVAAASF
jgi:hypothetical protein